MSFEPNRPMDSVIYIDGHPFEVSLPLCETPISASAKMPVNHWAYICSEIENKTMISCGYIMSWCNETTTVAGKQFAYACGGKETESITTQAVHHRSVNIGFRPILIPLDPATMEPYKRPNWPLSPKYHDGSYRNGKYVKLGTLYMGKSALKHPTKPILGGDIPHYTPDSTITIGDTDSDPANQIQWIRLNGILICKSNILLGVSYDDLLRNGFVSILERYSAWNKADEAEDKSPRITSNRRRQRRGEKGSWHLFDSRRPLNEGDFEGEYEEGEFEVEFDDDEDEVEFTMIDGELYSLILPIDCRPGEDDDGTTEFTTLVETLKTQGSVNDLHWSGIASLTMAPNTNRLDDFKISIRGGLTPYFHGSTLPTTRAADIGYRPMLVPASMLISDHPEKHIYNSPPNGTKITLGTLYLDDMPQKNPKAPTPIGDIPDYIPGTKISIRDTSEDPSEQIHWFYVNGFLIADRVILKNVTWFELYQQGLAFGVLPPAFWEGEDDDYEDEESEQLDDSEIGLILNIIKKLIHLPKHKLEILIQVVNTLSDPKSNIALLFEEEDGGPRFPDEEE